MKQRRKAKIQVFMDILIKALLWEQTEVLLVNNFQASREY